LLKRSAGGRRGEIKRIVTGSPPGGTDRAAVADGADALIVLWLFLARSARITGMRRRRIDCC
jgi:hypothetical protein